MCVGLSLNLSKEQKKNDNFKMASSDGKHVAKRAFGRNAVVTRSVARPPVALSAVRNVRQSSWRAFWEPLLPTTFGGYCTNFSPTPLFIGRRYADKSHCYTKIEFPSLAVGSTFLWPLRSHRNSDRPFVLGCTRFRVGTIVRWVEHVSVFVASYFVVDDTHLAGDGCRHSVATAAIAPLCLPSDRIRLDPGTHSEPRSRSTVNCVSASVLN